MRFKPYKLVSTYTSHLNKIINRIETSQVENKQKIVPTTDIFDFFFQDWNFFSFQKMKNHFLIYLARVRASRSVYSLYCLYCLYKELLPLEQDLCRFYY